MRKRETYIFATQLNRRPFRHFWRNFLLIVLLLLALAAAVNITMNHQVRVDSLRVTVPELPADLEGYSILHFSDLHGQELGRNQRQIGIALGSLSSSSVAVFTGDMVGAGGDVGPLLELSALLPGNMPRLLVPGDEDPHYLDAYPHRYDSPLADWAAEAVNAGFTILDAPYLVARGNGGRARLWFIPEEIYTMNLDALSDTYTAQLSSLSQKSSLTPNETARRRVTEYQLDRISRIRESLSSIRATDVQIVVTHSPLSAELAGTITAWSGREDLLSLRRAALILAGQCCGGGWRLPFVGPLWSEDGGFFPGDEGISGLCWLNGTPQYISPGLAMHTQTVWQPFRLFNSPTVTRLVLTSRIN